MENKKILIVDDDDNIRDTYASVFKKEGFEVIEAIDGLEGLDKAIKNLPDIIFTGIVMPKMNGFELIESLKKNDSTRDIPIVISSHLGSKEDRLKAESLGAKDFIVRSFYTPYEAVQKIKLILNLNSEYKIKFNPEELDAEKLTKDMHMVDKFSCFQCKENLVMSIKFSNIEKRIFTGSFICPKCGKTIK